MLKAGNGVASRASCTISLNDFIEDPNLLSPAVVADKSYRKRGTFFGKLKERNILSNKALRVKYYQRLNGVDSLIKTNLYIVTDIKQSQRGKWVLNCKDVLYKADDEKSQFPKVVTGKLNAPIASGTTSFTMQGDIADWTPFAKYVAVIGKDLLIITNATGNASAVTLTVSRSLSITLGGRTIINEPDDHSAGDEVFRGRIFANSDPYDILEAIFLDSGITTSEYDGVEMQSELDSWLANLTGHIDCIFYESRGATQVLNDFCKSFMLDIWTDTTIGKVRLKATSPWNSTVATLNEGKEIIYGSMAIDESKSFHHSRAFLQYDKRRLTEGDEDTNFARSSLAINSDLEGEFFYDDETVNKLGKSIILSNKTQNIETADLTTVRSAQRFSNRPQSISFEMDEANVNFDLGDVIEVVTNENQDFYGNPKQGVRAQVTQISPKNNIGRTYKISSMTYNPFIGGIAGTDITVNTTLDINLFTEAGGPVDDDTFTFLLDGQPFGQSSLLQAITIGSFPADSIVNIVCLNGAIITGKGGRGGNGESYIQGNPNTPATNGGNGGLSIKGQSGVTVNIYLSGDTGDLGNGAYTADGYLFAAGGGGGGGDVAAQSNEDDFGVIFYGGSGGGVGAGYTSNNNGAAGAGKSAVYDGTAGQNGGVITGGDGGLGFDVQNDGGDGGDSGVDGVDANTATGGNAGSALDLNSGIINVITDGNIAARYKQGNGDAPTSIT